MIVINVQVNVNPLKRADFLEQAKHDTLVSRGFAGNISFMWSTALEDSNTFILYEEWESQAAFDAYRTSAAFKQAGEVLFPMMDGEPKTAYYTATALS